MNIRHLVFGLCCASMWQTTSASLVGDSVTGYAATLIPSISYEKIHFDMTAIVGSEEEFSGQETAGSGTVLLEYYADLDASSITIGVRHLTANAIVFNANLIRYEFGDIDWAGANDITGLAFNSAFAQELWPSESDPNAKWVGWGQDTSTPPTWNPVWDAVNKTITIDATNGYSIAPGYDVWAKFDIVAVPIPAAVWLFGSGLLGLAGVARRKKAV